MCGCRSRFELYSVYPALQVDSVYTCKLENIIQSINTNCIIDIFTHDRRRVPEHYVHVYIINRIIINDTSVLSLVATSIY